MSTEKIIKSKSGWLFLLITIVLFAVAALFLANFVLSAIAADRNPLLWFEQCVEIFYKVREKTEEGLIKT